MTAVVTGCAMASRSAMAIAAAFGGADHATHAAHGPADTRAESATHDAADRAGRRIAPGRTFLGATDDALRLRGNRQGHERGKRDSGENARLHR
jgi:hypothetical protein